MKETSARAKLPTFRFASIEELKNGSDRIIGVAVIETLSGPAAGNIRFISALKTFSIRHTGDIYRTALIGYDNYVSKYYMIDEYGGPRYDVEAKVGYFISNGALYRIREVRESDNYPSASIETRDTI